MKLLNRDQNPAYLSSEEQSLLDATLTSAGRYTNVSPLLTDEIDQRVALLILWQMPAIVLAAAIIEPLLSDPNFGGAALDPQVLELARRFRELDASRHDEDQNRAGRVERLRELLYVGYTNIEAALLCLAAHVVRMRSIKQLDWRSARLLAEDNEATFLPLVEMLGLWTIRHELGELGLEVLNPDNLWEMIRSGSNALQIFATCWRRSCVGPRSRARSGCTTTRRSAFTGGCGTARRWV
jgi:(p)ppGpp synthase/HD superfamily hydrolase